MRIFLTGGSGFVGGAAARVLSGAHEVLALARSEASAARARAAGATPHVGELVTIGPAALEGCDVVIHAAAHVGQWGSRAQFWSTNVAGTARLLSAARAAGVPRFVHISTEAVLFDGRPMRDLDESAPYPARTPFLYSETKAAAERAVLTANDPAGGFTTIALRPRLVWGPGDKTLLPALRQSAARGAFVWLDGGQARTSTCYIDNLVEGIRLALHQGAGGQAYFLTDGEVHSFRDFLTAYSRAAGVELSDRSLPGALVRPLAAALEGTWRRLRLPGAPPLTHFGAALLSRDCTLRIDRARAALGYRPTVSVAEGMARVAAARSPGPEAARPRGAARRDAG